MTAMRLLCIGSGLAAVLACAGAAAERRTVGNLVLENVPPTPPQLREQLRRYQNARAAAFADWLPDGSMLIATRFGQTTQLHRVRGPGMDRTQLTFFDEPVNGALAQPGSDNRYVFLKDTGGDEYFQIYYAGLSGTEAALTEPRTRNQRPLFARDGHLLVWTLVTPGSGDYDIAAMNPADPGSRRIVHEGSGAIFAADIAPNGREILVGRELSATSGKLYLLNAAGGALREINPSHSEIAYGAAVFAGDGRSILLTSDEGSDFKRLVQIELASGRQTFVSPQELRWDVERFDLALDGDTLAYAINEGGRSKLIIASLRTRRVLQQPQLPVGVLGALKFSPDSKRLAIGLNTATAPADVWVWDRAGARLDRWTTSETGGLDPGALVDPTLVRVKSFDGLQVPAWIYKPRRIARRAPVIIDIHGGPEAQDRPTFSTRRQYWIAELGAVVIAPNVRGSDGYGKTYLKLDNGPLRQDSVKDIGALLDWIATQPDLDPARVVVSGGSYGGFMALAALVAYNERLVGAVDLVGISNWITFLTHTEGYRRDLRRVEYGDERDPAMRATFEQISPLNLTRRMTKPLFVVAGRNDPRVPYTESEQIVAKVREQGTPVWFMMANDEGHGFRKKQNVDALREAESLFLHSLLRTQDAAGTAGAHP